MRLAATVVALLLLAHSALAETADSSSLGLAIRYENGEGVARDYARALQLYCEAANHGDAKAYFNLGWMYLNGHGVPRDAGIAVGWWRKAADAGIPQADNLLRLLSHTAPSTTLGCAPPAAAAPPPLAVAGRAQAPAAVLRLVRRIAAVRGLDPSLVLAVIAAESAFDARAISPRNAMGLMQLTPETAARYGVRDPFDSEQNIRGGTAYLQWLLQRFAGDLTLTLAAYNAGEGAVDFYGGVPPFAETADYIARIKRLYPIGWSAR